MKGHRDLVVSSVPLTAMKNLVGLLTARAWRRSRLAWRISRCSTKMQSTSCSRGALLTPAVIRTRPVPLSPRRQSHHRLSSSMRLVLVRSTAITSNNPQILKTFKRKITKQLLWHLLGTLPLVTGRMEMQVMLATGRTVSPLDQLVSRKPWLWKKTSHHQTLTQKKDLRVLSQRHQQVEATLMQHRFGRSLREMRSSRRKHANQLRRWKLLENQKTRKGILKETINCTWERRMMACTT
mmetsp:Transcript_13587/g.27531  ORF Transcript_13587/g.27531 Transcript_13587/m.27531 type:complete len:238 (+) Transcript_13587:1644-2357(+)